MFSRLSKPKLPQQPGSGRRNFRLSPLEIFIAGLIVVGGLYLITIWLGGLMSTDSATLQAAVEGATPNNGQLQRALTVSQKNQMDLEELGKKLDGLDKQLKELDKGKSPAALSARLKKLEKAVDGLDKAKSANGNGKLAARLKKLETGLAALEKQQKADAKQQAKLAELDKRLAALEKAPKATAKTAAKAPVPAELEKRLDSLDKQVAGLEKSLGGKAKSKPGAPDAALNKRVDGLGLTLSSVTTQLGKLQRENKRQAEQLAGLQKAPAPAKGKAPASSAAELARLAALEKQVSQLAKAEKASPAAGQAKLVKQLDTLEKQLDAQKKQLARASQDEKKARASLAALNKEVASLQKAQASLSAKASAPNIGVRLSSMEGQLAVLKKQQAAAYSDQEAKKLAARLDAQDKELDRLRSSLRRVRSPVPDPEALARQQKLASEINKVGQQQKELSQKVALLYRSPPAETSIQNLAVRLNAMEKKLAQTEKLASAASKAPSRASTTPKSPAAPAKPVMVKVEHKVTRGQTLYGLARRYDAKVSLVRKWNPKLEKRNKILIGETLIFYVPKKR